MEVGIKRAAPALIALLASTAVASAQVYPIIVPNTGASAAATPAGLQQLINGTSWINGTRSIGGSNWRDNYQLIHDTLATMGTWNSRGFFALNPTAFPPVIGDLACSASTANVTCKVISLSTSIIIPPATPSAVGGILASIAPSHQYATGVGSNGAISYAQPSASDILGLAPSATIDATQAANITGLNAVARSGSASDLTSGTLAASRLPAFSGGQVTSPSAGSVVLNLAPGGAVANLGYTPLNKAGDAMSGALGLAQGSQATGSPSTNVDLITPFQAQGLQAPANGLYQSGGLARYLMNPVGGPFLPAGLTAAQNAGFMTTSGSDLLSEFMVANGMISTSGYPSAWATSTTYQAYDSVTNGGVIYNNVTTSGGNKSACNSASGGTGPSGTGSYISDGTCAWAYAPFGTPQNGGKVLNYQVNYVQDGSNQVWVGVDNLILANSTHQVNAFTREIDITNNRLDYGAGGYGGSAVALQIFAGGNRRSSAAISIGASGVPTDAASLRNGIVISGASLVSDNTIEDLTNSYNGFYNLGSHKGSAFTDGGIEGSSGSAGYGFNFYGQILGGGAAFRIAGTPGGNSLLISGSATQSSIVDLSNAPISLDVQGSRAVGIKLSSGTYSFFQVQGTGWNVNSSGVLTTAALVSNAYTVASAPACAAATKGYRIDFTDVAGTPTYRQIGFSGGGSGFVPGECNGTSWELH